MVGAEPVIGRWRRAKPWSAPMASNWRQARFSAIDVETTGLDLRNDEIVSIGVVDVVHARIEVNRWYQVVRPSRPIETEAMKIHALTERDTVTAAREHHATGAALHQLRLTADTEPQGQQPALQTLTSVNPDQTHTLSYSQLDERNDLRHGDRL